MTLFVFDRRFPKPFADPFSANVLPMSLEVGRPFCKPRLPFVALENASRLARPLLLKHPELAAASPGQEDGGAGGPQASRSLYAPGFVTRPMSRPLA